MELQKKRKTWLDSHQPTLKRKRSSLKDFRSSTAKYPKFLGKTRTLLSSSLRVMLVNQACCCLWGAAARQIFVHWGGIFDCQLRGLCDGTELSLNGVTKIYPRGSWRFSSGMYEDAGKLRTFIWALLMTSALAVLRVPHHEQGLCTWQHVGHGLQAQLKLADELMLLSPICSISFVQNST